VSGASITSRNSSTSSWILATTSRVVLHSKPTDAARVPIW